MQSYEELAEYGAAMVGTPSINPATDDAFWAAYALSMAMLASIRDEGSPESQAFRIMMLTGGEAR